MMGVLFLREHNRIARSLARAYPAWDDERLFQTARNVLTVILIKIVVEEYINHISPYHLKLLADPTRFRNPRWYRQNWMSIEFNLLYRWHSLVPSSFRIRGRDVAVDGHAVQHRPRRRARAGCLLRGRLRPAGGPRRPLQLAAGDLGRRGGERASSRAPSRSAPTTSTAGSPASPGRPGSRTSRATRRVQQALRDLYGSVDHIEFYPGLFAEDVRRNAVLPSLIGRMVAIDAFSQAFTNPLLAPRVFNPETFTPLGWELIRTTRSLSDLLHRNVPDGGNRRLVTMTRPDWVRT